MKKQFLLLPILLFFLASCHSHESSAELDELKARSELEQQNLALVEKYIGIWNSQDFDGLDEILSPEFKIYIPSYTDDPMTLDEYREWFKGIVQAFPDIQYEIKELLARGNKVCLSWVCEASMPGNDPEQLAGEKATASAIEIYLVENGKIIEERTEMDALGWQLQMGYTLVPPSGAE